MATEQLTEGTLLNGRYRIEAAVGRGGMGTVYLAQHVRLDTIVAVKEVRGRNPDTDEYQIALEQCEQEARFLVRLNHPNLPKVTDAFVENDCFYLVMEFIDGVTLDAKLKSAGGQPLDVERVVDWGLQIADVLSYLHTQEPPIIFRDLKPSNAMVQPDGNVRLIDFGIARRFQPGADKDTGLFGSVGYSPPEQFGRHQTDPRSDIYAFGATLHHLLTGRDPAAQPFKFLPAHLLNPAVPESLSKLLDRCLAMEPNDRPADVHTVFEGLLAVRDELTARPLQAAPPIAEGITVPPAAVPTAPAGSPSGGPRIISTKLAQAEAQKRRASSREMPRVPSGSVTPEAAPVVRTPGSARALLLAVALLVLVGGASLAVVLAGARHHAVIPHPNPNPNPVPPNPDPPYPNPPNPDPPEPVPPVPDSPVQFESTDVKSGQDSDGEDALLVSTSGTLKSEKDSSTLSDGVVAAFFYDQDGNPLQSADPKNSRFATPSGQLSVSSTPTMTVVQDDKQFKASLVLPMKLMPSTLGDPGAQVTVQYRCVAFDKQKQRLGETPLKPLSFVLPGGAPAPTPPNSGQGNVLHDWTTPLGDKSVSGTSGGKETKDTGSKEGGGNDTSK